MSWLQPAAWWGLTAVAVPIIIHLLARERSRRLPFPSLRFLPPARVAALKRRVVSDWLLLALRVLIIVAATAALAGPVYVSRARREAWNERVAKAIVTVPGTGSQDEAARLADEEGGTSFVASRFSAPHVPDAIAAGLAWLREQPPAAREVVVIGDLREGVLTDRDLEAVPPAVGVRLLPVAVDALSREFQVQATAVDDSGRPTAYDVVVIPDQRQTHVRYTRAAGPVAPAVQLAAGPTEQDRANAVLGAVFAQGVRVERGSDRRLTIAFTGGSAPTGAVPGHAWMRDVLAENPDVRGEDAGGTLIVRANMSVADARAPGLVARLVRSAFATSLDRFEPRRIAPATLARWSRPPGPAPLDAPLADEGDRRWLWALALLLLATEQLVRQQPRAVPSAHGGGSETHRSEPGGNASMPAEDPRVA